jgi:hypothetical protein
VYVIVCVLVLNYEFLVSNIFPICFTTEKRKMNTRSFNFTGTKSSLEGNQLEGSDRHPDALVFDLSSIVVATDNFSPTNKLGEGGFGSVFKVQSQQFIYEIVDILDIFVPCSYSIVVKCCEWTKSVLLLSSCV